MAKISFPFSVLRPVKKHLEDKEKKLKKRKRDLTKEDPFRDTDRLNDNAAVDTEAAEEEGHERVFVLKREIDKTLIRVRKALTKIKLGKYGVCESCGQMIDTDRLAVDPTVETCMVCAKKKTKK